MLDKSGRNPDEAGEDLSFEKEKKKQEIQEEELRSSPRQNDYVEKLRKQKSYDTRKH